MLIIRCSLFLPLNVLLSLAKIKFFSFIFTSSQIIFLLLLWSSSIADGDDFLFNVEDAT